MTLPLPLDYAAMEAKPVAALPEGDGWQYEPKWDGFRCLAFRDGASVAFRHPAAPCRATLEGVRKCRRARAPEAETHLLRAVFSRLP